MARGGSCAELSASAWWEDKTAVSAPFLERHTGVQTTHRSKPAA